MTVASEIQRLQGAKADLKTAIENKGITVPSSATLDEYDSYVDQINTGGWIGGLKLYPYLISTTRTWGQYATPPISREENGAYYGLCGITYASYSGDDIYMPVCVFKKTSNSDIQYLQTSGAPYIDNGVRGVINFSAYRNGNNVRGFSFGNYNHTYEQYRYTQCIQFDWNIVNHTLSSTDLGHGTYGDYDPLNYGADLTGYTQLSGSTWVDNTGLLIQDNGYYLCLYLTLK